MTRVILIGPSFDSPEPARWLRKCARSLRVNSSDYLVAVDNGLRWSECFGAVKLAVGDWDSASKMDLVRARMGGAHLVTLRPQKNKSDLAAALERVSKLGATELILLGFTGGRPDHHISNLFEITNFAVAHASKSQYQKIAAIGPEAEYHFLTHKQPSFRAVIPRGTVVSVFATGQGARGVGMKGFEYGMKNSVLLPSSRGLSNIVQSQEAEIQVRRGVLWVVIPHAR